MLASQLFEMATPRETQRGTVYFHGTQTEAAAREILQNGLDPAAMNIKWGEKKTALRPEEGKVYITPDLSYAMIYALGGDMFGHTSDTFLEREIKKYGEYGYVFEIKGKDLQDISVDEDSIGKLLYKFWQKPEDVAHINVPIRQLGYLARKHCTDNQIKKVKEGEYTAWAQVGKKLNKVLPDELKLDLIDSGMVHVTHTGKLKVSRCWRFSKRDMSKIKKDGSNFKKYARLWRG